MNTCVDLRPARGKAPLTLSQKEDHWGNSFTIRSIPGECGVGGRYDSPVPSSWLSWPEASVFTVGALGAGQNGEWDPLLRGYASLRLYIVRNFTLFLVAAAFKILSYAVIPFICSATHTFIYIVAHSIPLQSSLFV